MTKETEIALLLETAHKLGVNSYCGEWLTQMLDPLTDCIKSDLLPEIYFSDARYEAEARAKQLKTVTDAKEFAERVMAQAEIDAETLRREAREDVQRERERLAKWHASLLDIMRAGVRKLEEI